jgi:hypothetical protein
VREGQALWLHSAKSSEIAGELLVASKPGGRVFVQFSKNPFPMLLAQTTADAWEVRLPLENRRYSGPGRPPRRLIWLYLPGLLAGDPPPKNWEWQSQPDGHFRLHNPYSGETISGFLDR